MPWRKYDAMGNDLSQSSADGFTLLELLLSMAITAIIVGLIFGVFRVGVRAWERGERDIERQQRLRVVLELMKKQIASLTPSTVLMKQGSLIAFEGRENRITLISKLALNPQHRFGDVYSQFIVENSQEGAELFFTEEEAPRVTDPVDVDEKEAKTERRSLLSNMRAVAFQFLKPPDKDTNYDWQSEWDPAVETGLPLAVRISLLDQTDTTPMFVVIPIRSRERW